MTRRTKTTEERGIGYGGVAGTFDGSWKWRRELYSLVSRSSSPQVSFLHIVKHYFLVEKYPLLKEKNISPSENVLE